LSGSALGTPDVAFDAINLALNKGAEF